MTEALCARCGHAERAHLASGPNATPWCRRCYGDPLRHRTRDHAFEPAGS